MSRIDFYHLQKSSLDEALPKLVLKAYETGKKIKIKVGNDLRVDFINSLLWTFDDESFVPHGTKKDGFAEMQPVYLSAEDDLPNEAVFLFLVEAADINLDNAVKFERIFYIFAGNNENELIKARTVWKAFSDSDFERHYWQQNAEAKWEEKTF